jgi:adenylate cyclase
MRASTVKLPSERSVRLVAGLIMYAYTICHFISHATGLFLLDAIQAVGHDLLLAPWRTPLGLTILLTCFLVHFGLALRALYRRRHLRMPALEAWQLGLGLLAPLLLVPHLTDARLGVLLYGLDDSYFRVLYKFWLTEPGTALPRQFALLIVVWIHGSIGIHMWLRFRAWYRRGRAGLAAAALLLPLLAILGVVNAGWDTVLRAAVEPGFVGAHGSPTPGTPEAAAAAALVLITNWLEIGYVALVAAVFALRALRAAHERRSHAIQIDYWGGRRVRVPRGFSILEASRWAGIPHASVCGARGRCSTCRVRVTRGLDGLAPPSPAERATLARIGAPAGIRLACQVRPTFDVAVRPLVPATRPLDGLRVALDEGRELVVTALCVDLRDSTRLAAGRLPFDAVFIVDRYVQAVTASISARGGHITSVAGDGIMSMFGIDGDAAAGAQRAIAAVAEVWRAIDKVSEELSAEIGSPLRFGIGVHSGLSVVGALGWPEQATIQFLGDTGNVAARLEGLTKEMNCVAVVSAATVDAAGVRPSWQPAEVDVRGRDQRLPVFMIHCVDQMWCQPLKNRLVSTL